MSSEKRARLFRPWHVLPVLLTVLVLGGSLALGDARPLLVAFWWMGVGTLALGVAGGLILGFVVFFVGLKRQWSARREARREGVET